MLQTFWETVSSTTDWRRAAGANLHELFAIEVKRDTVPGGHHEIILFRAEDLDAWIVLGVSFFLLLLIDLFLLSAWSRKMSLKWALITTAGWIGCGAAFNFYVYSRFGETAAWQWTSAYVLEWLLSFDNLFVFHSIFSMYKTPESLRHRPLFIGIVGAVFFRLGFLFVGEYLMHMLWFAHLGFGALLIFTGINSAMDNDDDEIEDNWVVRMVTKHCPMVNYYDPTGAFFVKVPVDANGEEVDRKTSGADERGEKSYGSVEPRSRVGEAWRGTMLVLVVVCIEVADLVFAVDSVSAVVAQVNTLFLAYSAVIFAMLGLRAGYFVIDALASTFELFKYGISAILIFIGVKLIFSKVFYIPPVYVCLILFGTLAMSVVLSIIVERLRNSKAGSSASSVKNSPMSENWTPKQAHP